MKKKWTNRHEYAWRHLEHDGYTTNNSRWIIEEQLKEADEWCEFIRKNFGHTSAPEPSYVDDGSHWFWC